MPKTPKRSRTAAKPQPQKKEPLSEEQLDKVSGGIVVNWDGATQVREAALDTGLGGTDTTLGPQPHLINPKLGQ
jgi:hypothetical protein